jgi:hypothetical protein
MRLAEKLKCARASFGDYVRAVAGDRGLEPHRDNLQAVGLELIESGWEPFCRAVLAHSTWQPGQSLVVDGVRHVEAVRQLRSLVAPSTVVLVYLRIDEELRRGRLSSREGQSGAAGETHDTHPTEDEVKTALPRLADLVLDGARPVDQLVDEIIDFAVSISKKQAAEKS